MKRITKCLLSLTLIIHLYWYNYYFPIVPYSQYNTLPLSGFGVEQNITNQFPPTTGGSYITYSKTHAFILDVKLDQESIDKGIRLSRTYYYAAKVTSIHFESYETGLLVVHNNYHNPSESFTLVAHPSYSDSYSTGVGLMVMLIFGSFIISLLIIALIACIGCCCVKQKRNNIKLYK